MQSKTEFLDDVLKDWYIGALAVEVCSWAIADKERIILDYLSRHERTEEDFVIEEHYVVTDGRVLHFELITSHSGIAQYSPAVSCPRSLRFS